MLLNTNMHPLNTNLLMAVRVQVQLAGVQCGSSWSPSDLVTYRLDRLSLAEIILS